MATTASRIATRLRALRRDERGASAPFLVIASIIIFGIVSVAFGGGLHAAMGSMQDQKVNSTLASNANKLASKEANRGYLVARSLPASSSITVTVGGRTVTGKRLVAVDTTNQTAQITVTFGKFIAGKWTNVSECTAKPERCVTSQDLASATLAQSIPEAVGVTAIDPATNITAGDPEVQFADVASGTESAIAIDHQGSLWGWGANTKSELGNNTTTALARPTKITVAGSVKFTQVEMGAYTSYAIGTNGLLYAWGDNSAGQTGVGDTAVPKPVSTTLKWKQVDAGPTHACALTTVGHIYCWGSGTGRWKSTSSASTPQRITPTGESASSPTARTFAYLSVGQAHQLAADTAGNVWAWGTNGNGQLGNGTETGLVNAPTQISSDLFTNAITKVAAGNRMSYAIDAFGRAFAWGFNGTGALGDGTTTNRTTAVRIAPDLQFSEIEAGYQKAYGVTRANSLYAWGSNGGFLGDGKADQVNAPAVLAKGTSIATVTSPVTVDSISFAVDSTHRIWSWGTGAHFGDGKGESAARPTAQQNRLRLDGGLTISSVDTSSTHAVAIATDGSAWSWGKNGSGQLGIGSTTDSSVPKETVATYSNDAYDVTIGLRHVFVVGKLGTIVATGSNGSKQIGGQVTSGRVDAPRAVTTTQFAKVVAGRGHNIGIERSTGKVVGWGQNTDGQASPSETATNIQLPTAVAGIPDSVRIIDVAAGDDFSMAVGNDGSVWVWGASTYGQHGNGFTASGNRAATRVDIDANVTAVAAGGQFALALDETGAVWSWGRNDAGQTGLGTEEAKRSLPAKLTVPEPISDLAAGAAHGVLAAISGNVYTWGSAATSGFGADQTTPKLVPRVSSEKVVKVAAGGGNTITITQSGAFWMWGDSANESLGGAPMPSPTKMRASGDVVAVATGVSNTAVVLSSGAVMMAGTDEYGQIGDGTSVAPATLTAYTHFNDALADAAPAYAKDANGWKTAKFATLSPGNATTAGIDEQGHWWTWGSGTSGQLGTGKGSTSSRPALAATSTRFTTVDSGDVHTAAVAADGTAWGVGTNASAQLARTVDKLRTPVRLPIVSDLALVAAGHGNTAFVSRKGNLTWTLGSDASGQRRGVSGWRPSSTATTSIVDIAITARGIALLRSNGLISTWGETPGGSQPLLNTTYSRIDGTGEAIAGIRDTALNQIRTIGLPSPISPGAPYEVSLISDAMFADVAIGTEHTVAVDTDGSVWTWGAPTSPVVPRTDGAQTPQRLGGFGGSTKLALVPEKTAATSTTFWDLGTIASGAKGSVQVNVKAKGMPVRAIAVVCSNGSIKSAADTVPSSGEFRYANIDLGNVSGCGSPRIAAVIDGKPATASEVQTMVLPTVYAAAD